MSSKVQVDKDYIQAEQFDLVVLGGGISGISTALLAQGLGAKVLILSQNAHLGAEPISSLIPTGYAMASAYPHFSNISGLVKISAESQVIFEALSRQNNSGVSIIRVYEVFEEEPPEALLSENRMNFQRFAGKPESFSADTGIINPPVRPGAAWVSGWRFDSYFCDMPIYLPYLWARFLEGGGHLKECLVTDSTIENLPGAIPVVNCLGIGALGICDDSAPYVVQRGRQVLARDLQPVYEDGLPVAYNYTPTASVFARGDGSAEYLHFFSRSDGYILGQTREPGKLDENGKWQGEPTGSLEIDCDGIAVPVPIIELNRQILAAWKNVDFHSSKLVGREGYRFYRDPDASGVRIESEIKDGRQIVHNYGHGGSGITMSWGCALAALRLLHRNQSPRFCIEPPEGAELSSLLSSMLEKQPG